MKIVIPGGSGQVGTILSRAFHARGDEVVVLTRRPSPASWGRVVAWDGSTVGPWHRELDGADVVINLAGRNVNCRYHAANRAAIMESRTASTRAVGAAIARVARPPAVWLQASTATIYSHRHATSNDEETGSIGGEEPGAPTDWRFSIEVARAWEEACHEADTPATRRVLMRSAMIMSPDPGGIFDTLLALVRCGLGGTAGNGRQYISWIHHQDFVRAVDHLIERRELTGPVNIAAPAPLPNREFMRILREAWGTRIGLPASEWMLALGAFLLRTETELVLKSRRVVSVRLAQGEFGFHYPGWRAAARDLCERWRNRRRNQLEPVRPEHDGPIAVSRGG